VEGQHDSGNARQSGVGKVTGDWWRRNRWGLIGLVPAFAVAMAVPVHDQFGAFWDRVPRTAVAAAPSGWVSFDGARMRATALAPAIGLSGDSGPITLPPTDAVWRATIDFRAPSSSALSDCDLRMVDSAGASYEANPAELTDLGLSVGPATCAPDDTTGTPSQSWTEVVYFLAPSDVRAVSVRVLVPAKLPRFAQLTVAR
jgi:hypothetical protein